MPYLTSRSIASDGTITLTFKNGNFDYELKVQLLDTTANFEFTVTKDIISKVAARFTLKGSFGQFRSKSNIRISGGQIREFGQSNEKLGGNATISLVVEGSGSDLGYSKTFPIFKVPFVVGYIPVSLDIGAQFVVNAVVPIGATAKISADFTYDSDMGLSYDGSKLDASANVGGHTISVGGDQPYAGGTTQISANFGVGFPHIEVSIGHKWLAEGACWFHPAFLIGGSWTSYNSPIPNCMKVDSQYILAAGYSISVLDGLLKPLDGKKTLFQETKPLWEAGDCPQD